MYLWNLAFLIDSADTAAASGCGQSDFLYDKRVQGAYASILERAPEAERSETEAALRLRGFDPTSSWTNPASAAGPASA